MHLRWIWAPWVQLDSLFSVLGGYSDDLSQYTILVNFAMLSGLSEQRGDLIGSPRALYEEGVVQPLVFTI